MVMMEARAEEFSNFASSQTSVGSSTAAKMVDAQEIYRRFCATPLRLRSKPTPPTSSSSSTRSDESPAVSQLPELPPLTPNYRTETPRKPATKEDVERLKEQIAVECRVDDFHTPPRGGRQPHVPVEKVVVAKAKPTTQRATKPKARSANPESAIATAPMARQEEGEVVGRKQKRVTRAVALVNSNTGGVCVDTPTKALAPPKRSRKSTRQQQQHSSPPKPVKSPAPRSPEFDTRAEVEKSLAVTLFASYSPESDEHDVEMDDAEKENGFVDSLPISRNIMDAFAEIDDALPLELLQEKSTTPKKASTPKKALTPMKALTPRKNVEVTIPKETAVPVAKEVTASKKQAAAKKQPAPKKKPAAKRERAPKRTAKQAVQPPRLGTRRSSRLQNKEEHASEMENNQLDDEQFELLTTLEPETVEDVEHVEPEPVPAAVINVESAFCEPLLQTKTASGGLFALWFHALKQEIETAEETHVDEFLEILSAFFALCMGISQSEAMAKNHNSPEKDADDKEAAESNQTSSSETGKRKKKKKSVVFRHFDLSTLDLRYEDEDSAAKFAETLLRHYVLNIHEHTLTLHERCHTPTQAAMVEHVISILSNTDRLAEQSTHDGLVATAFREMSELEQAEVRVCQPFFNAEFAKLSPKIGTSHSSPPPFLRDQFASIVSSLVRFRLRELFLPFDPEGLLDEGEQLKIAKYEHQHFGAAIHRALKEIHEYQSLVAPLLAIISSRPTPSEDAIKQAILLIDIEDLVHVEQYILACRYLRLSFSRCILLDGSEDEDTLYFCDRLEYVCALARRLQFEDEAHLFALASVEDFVKVLEHREPSLTVLEKTLLLVNMPNYATEVPCVECNEIVTRAQQDEAITCSSCDGRFHLSCLHLPASFLQFANQYTCPFCYTGRARR